MFRLKSLIFLAAVTAATSGKISGAVLSHPGADSISIDSAFNFDNVNGLREVVITGKRTLDTEIIPAQALSGDALQKLNSNSVADALRYFAGVQVKDYGGVGGIKTVNIRSMGTNHTGVVYDGVELGNAQNGQIDLGQFSLDNMESISLYNGQKSRILQPAKDFGAAGTIYLRTRAPRFEDGQKYRIRGSLRFGSFDLINPSALLELKLSDQVNAQISTEWVNSSGKYKFRYRRVTPAGDVAYDTTAIRQNGDLNAVRVEMNLNGTLTHGGWSFKVYNYTSNRGIPGAIVNNVWRRGERLRDNNTFVQGQYRITYGKWSSLNHIKYAFYRTHYINNDKELIKVDNTYRQQEVYFSTAHRYALTTWWDISAAWDFQWNTLGADSYNFTRPNRYSNFMNMATAIELRRLKIQASALGTFIRDKVHNTGAASSRSVFTPAVFISFNPLHNTDWSVRTFFKQSFRMPTFNDLYYADMGNARLTPERVTQYNLGVLYNHNGNAVLANAQLSVDAYYNRVKDKIIAYPKGQQFRWTMLNLGLVDIRGIDAAASVTVNPWDKLLLTVRGQYTFQRAIDITNPSDNFYRHQIPYIPRHSGSAVVNAVWKGWGINYSWIYVGERYNQQENILYNYTQPWYTSDISLSKDFKIRKIGIRVLMEVNNLLSQDYDVIINYPMPKRNYRCCLTVEI